ncbi:MAG: hypothetical protein MPW17_06050 [Candidatus Manganitrophus sp.]|nr:hypothetical protein [Candidatus Manganitrophus sp.]WDT72396.1 MAG: hypothetical protein MPW17_06050 [Candidatus Manganitrophus sp.]
MDILTIMGVVVGLAALIGGQHLEGGHLSSVTQFTAAIIVLGGTLGAVMVQYSLPKFLEGIKLGISTIKSQPDHSVGYIKQLVDYANIVRKQGILALEPKVKEVKDPFFKKDFSF